MDPLSTHPLMLSVFQLLDSESVLRRITKTTGIVEKHVHRSAWSINPRNGGRVREARHSFCNVLDPER